MEARSVQLPARRRDSGSQREIDQMTVTSFTPVASAIGGDADRHVAGAPAEPIALALARRHARRFSRKLISARRRTTDIDRSSLDAQIGS
jgi:hypothetical protein